MKPSHNEEANDLKFGFDLDGAWLTPTQHLESVKVAEKLEYESVWIGDHFLPWFHNEAQAPSVWPWLGAALASSSRIKIGPAVTVPIGGRYNPILVGQAAATLDSMFPGRFLLGVGTGQAMSEQRFLGRWPEWKERGERLREGLALIRKLWESEDYFDWSGTYFNTEKIYLYTRPAGPIDLYVSARGKYAARIAGTFGDHLMTTVGSPEKVKNEIIPEFDRAMKKTGRDPAKAYRIAYVEFGLGDVDYLVRMLKNGSAAQGLVDAARNEIDPRKIQEMGSQVPAETLIKYHHLVSRAEELIAPAQDLIDAGCNYVLFSDESRHPNENMKRIKEEVIPHLKY